MMRKAPIAVVAGLLVLVGCSGEDSNGGETQPPGTQSVATGPVVHDHGPGAGEQGCPMASDVITIVASGTKFNTDCLSGTANQTLTLSYENKDQISHGLVLLETHNSSDPFFRVDVFAGPNTQTFTIPAQTPGSYAFHCQVHPSAMRGTLLVK